MPRLSSCRILAACLAAAVALPATAQRVPVGTTAWSGVLAGYGVFGADLDSGGDADFAGGIARLDAFRQFSPTFGAGLSLSYDFEHWSFSGTPAAFGANPWGNIHRPGVSLPLVWTTSREYAIGFTPTVEWSYEQGADTGDALVAGALLTVVRTFSQDLTLGLGVGVYDGIEKTKVFPVFIVNWDIDERWRLANPFQAGPTGGAGLELAYRVNDAWEIAGGGTWRSARFRLDRDGPNPGGIGVARSFPLFVRASWQPSGDVRLDFLAGATVGGTLKWLDPGGSDLVEDDVGAAPILGVTLRTRF